MHILLFIYTRTFWAQNGSNYDFRWYADGVDDWIAKGGSIEGTEATAKKDDAEWGIEEWSNQLYIIPQWHVITLSLSLSLSLPIYLSVYLSIYLYLSLLCASVSTSSENVYPLFSILRLWMGPFQLYSAYTKYNECKTRLQRFEVTCIWDFKKN